jgi:rubrerythrin
MTAKWKFEDINWSLFDPTKVNSDILRIIKAGSVVEHNGADYGTYLSNVFEGDVPFQKEIKSWEKDEVKHGKTLARWVELADPSYNFDERFKAYREGFPIDTETKISIRGSRGAELLTRCMVEIGTSSFYSALKDATDEPLLKQICAKIAADELRHYKLFYTHFQRYQEKEKLGIFKRFKVAVSRILENEDEELAFAYYTSNQEKGPFDCAYYTKVYGQVVYRCYQKVHVDRGIALLCKAIGVNPQGYLQKILSFIASYMLTSKERIYRKALQN